MFVVVAICLLLVLVFCFVFTNPTINDKTIISCDCKELQTWHPGQVQHKMSCPIFRKRNPNLTFGEFMEKEGFDFPGVNDANWPPLKMEYPQLKSPMPV
jgi:hypothetical protein